MIYDHSYTLKVSIIVSFFTRGDQGATVSLTECQGDLADTTTTWPVPAANIYCDVLALADSGGVPNDGGCKSGVCAASRPTAGKLLVVEEWWGFAGLPRYVWPA